MAAKRKKKRGGQKPRKKTHPRPAPRKKQRKKRYGRVRKFRDWRSASSRSAIVKALKAIAPSLAKALTRAPLNSDEAIYLRGIANLKMGKKVTNGQALALLAASRMESPLHRSIFGAREAKLVYAFLGAMNKLAKKRSRTPGDLLRWTNINPAVALQLANAQATGRKIYYRDNVRGVTQRWTAEGFRRFITNPIYKSRREEVFKGTFWIARPDPDGDRRKLPKRGKTRIRVS